MAGDCGHLTKKSLEARLVARLVSQGIACRVAMPAPEVVVAKESPVSIDESMQLIQQFPALHGERFPFHVLALHGVRRAVGYPPRLPIGGELLEGTAALRFELAEFLEALTQPRPQYLRRKLLDCPVQILGRCEKPENATRFPYNI